ncbi:MAG: hypothetical protein PHD97_10160 [Bacteroidales bacterium]|nr:hypothetical protein [Bacteroidales bacterium]
MLKELYNKIKESRVWNLSNQNDLINKSKYRWLIFTLGFILIIVWQSYFVFNGNKLSDRYGRADASGFTHIYAKNFFYYFYYLDIFPVATTYKPLTFSKSFAEKSIKEHGDSLLMEWKHWSRLGENARIFMYLPNAIIKGSAENPTIIPANYLLFIFSLLLFYFFAFYNGYFFLGFFIVLLVGSNPFCLYETYNNENIFSLVISLLLVLTSIHFHLFLSDKKFKNVNYLLPVISGLIIGTAVHVRGEIIVLVVSMAFIYVTLSKTNWIKKVVLCFLLIMSFSFTKSYWTKYFDKKYNEACIIVKENGGNPYYGARTAEHCFWHPVFCGLGDFGEKYGYGWDKDQDAYAYALPILKDKYGIELKWKKGELGLDEYYDKQKKYYKYLPQWPEYQKVLKDKVFHDVKNDPFWYVSVIGKRIDQIFTYTSPVWITVANHHLNIKFNSWWFIPIVLLLFILRKWFYVKLLLYSLPLAIPPLIIYSKRNITLVSCFHLILVAVLLCLLLEIVLMKFLKKTNN